MAKERRQLAQKERKGQYNEQRQPFAQQPRRQPMTDGFAAPVQRAYQGQTYARVAAAATRPLAQTTVESNP